MFDNFASLFVVLQLIDDLSRHNTTRKTHVEQYRLLACAIPDTSPAAKRSMTSDNVSIAREFGGAMDWKAACSVRCKYAVSTSGESSGGRLAQVGQQNPGR